MLHRAASRTHARGEDERDSFDRVGAHQNHARAAVRQCTRSDLRSSDVPCGIPNATSSREANEGQPEPPPEFLDAVFDVGPAGVAAPDLQRRHRGGQVGAKRLELVAGHFEEGLPPARGRSARRCRTTIRRPPRRSATSCTATPGTSVAVRRLRRGGTTSAPASAGPRS
jgi:hypothetical protein